jgi:hypothetical protein
VVEVVLDESRLERSECSWLPSKASSMSQRRVSMAARVI